MPWGEKRAKRHESGARHRMCCAPASSMAYLADTDLDTDLDKLGVGVDADTAGVEYLVEVRRV